ncbi:hypothetical protein CONPUDRAFT_86087 [Coniophora puteana RWD-64-598 SS2]|uniref:Uncharacterized protein n=1 Tax=Coniophora puteana (strain RWD-64-598) TaxID=741705 RepID=R7SFZ6_CONPW|nr:uncharacterized protein CONPUDRAFT_86087 [Coniophora puteana RWD-64-598 SS2]EIW74009.1 hypothetical protein CONPUDRAFT_86087 [Coniophora puteana RWD-64-598 SS2]
MASSVGQDGGRRMSRLFSIEEAHLPSEVLAFCGDLCAMEALNMPAKVSLVTPA